MAQRLSLVMLLFISVGTHAQDSVLTKFLRYRREVVQEKMFLHTDRDTYLTGETMWVKIYTVDASFHAPIDLSKVAYVEIVDGNNQSVVREKISLSNGIGNGSVFLPASVGSGKYILRAYTSWMQNFNSDLFFRKPVTIINSFLKLETSPVSTAVATHDIQFFPEGGTMLGNIQSRIGFKVSRSNGTGVDFSGTVLDDNNDTLVRFQPLKFGMGSFDFTPSPDRKYRAVIRVPGTYPATVDLPAVVKEGYSMHLEDKGDVLNVDVSVQPAQSGFPVYLLAHTRQQVAKAERRTISQGKVSFVIQKKDLKDGISHITLFDAISRPVAERLYFKVPANDLGLSVQGGSAEYRTRGKVTLDVQSNRAVPQMSVAVYRLDSLTAANPLHINHFIYLTSDLRGFVESPEFYFTSDPDARAAADNLMLTQGWRRFNWAEVMNAQRTFTYAPEFHGPIVRGVVKDLNGTIAPNILSYVSVPGKVVDVYTSRSNNKGEVSFEMKHFFGVRKVLTVADSLHRVELVSPFSLQPTFAPLSEFILSPTVGKNLLARSIGMQVQNVYFDNRYETPRIDSAAFYGTADETYLLDDYTRFPVMEEVMREYVRGVMVRKQGGKFKFYLLDMVNKKPIYETPIILVDGVPVFDVDKVMAYDPRKVRKLEVVTRKFHHGLSTHPGIVSYTTYNGDLDGFDLDTRYVNVDYEGLQLRREFYSPRHEYDREGEARLPDQRSLLYWNGSLATDESKKQSLQFCTSDVTGTFQVVVEGMTSDGVCGYTTQTFSVKK